MRIDSLRNTLWSASAGPAPEYPRWKEDAEADVAIIGAGYLGLSTALHLAEMGVRVIVLEAISPGHGASGRNSGFVVPSFVTPLGPSRVRSVLGSELSERLCLLAGDSGNLVFDLIRKRHIECDAEQSGWLQPAHSATRIGFLERRQAEWARLGKTLELLDRDETIRLTGVPSYSAALLDRTGGQLNPLGFALGLARAAMSAGATIWIDAPVTEVRRDGRRWRLRCRGGRVSVESVLLATNVLDGTLAPRVARSRVPLVVYQIATEALDEANRERILPENQCASDTRRDIFAYRWTRDGRLVTGGAGFSTIGSSQQVYLSLLRRLQSMVCISGPCNVAYGWNGVIAITRNFLPQVSEIGNGLFAAVGCCGRGLALSTALGRELATYLQTGDSGALSVPVGPPSPIPGHAFIKHLPALLLPWSRMRDRIETGKTTQAP